MNNKRPSFKAFRQHALKNSIVKAEYDALAPSHEMERQKLEALRAHLAQGVAQARGGEFVENYSIETIIQELDAE